MTISKEKVKKAITLKQSYAKKLSELNTGENELVGHDYFRDAEKRNKGLNDLEALQEYRLLKEFLEGLSEAEFQELQAIAFYGRRHYGNYAEALNEAISGGSRGDEIGYTINLTAAADYLEAGIDKMNQRHEI